MSTDKEVKLSALRYITHSTTEDQFAIDRVYRCLVAEDIQIFSKRRDIIRNMHKEWRKRQDAKPKSTNEQFLELIR